MSSRNNRNPRGDSRLPMRLGALFTPPPRLSR